MDMITLWITTLPSIRFTSHHNSLWNFNHRRLSGRAMCGILWAEVCLLLLWCVNTQRGYCRYVIMYSEPARHSSMRQYLRGSNRLGNHSRSDKEWQRSWSCQSYRPPSRSLILNILWINHDTAHARIWPLPDGKLLNISFFEWRFLNNRWFCSRHCSFQHKKNRHSKNKMLSSVPRDRSRLGLTFLNSSLLDSIPIWFSSPSSCKAVVNPLLTFVHNRIKRNRNHNIRLKYSFEIVWQIRLSILTKKINISTSTSFSRVA